MSDQTATGDDPLTLDPPGSIAVVGAGPLGMEAALYGRYLGYDVTLMEAVAVGNSMRDRLDEPLPMLPDRCLSQLAVSALRSQRADTTAEQVDQVDCQVLPMTYRQWIDDWLVPLAESDLLRDRLRMPARVTNIQCVPAQTDETDGDIPPDFRLTFVSVDGQQGQR